MKRTFFFIFLLSFTNGKYVTLSAQVVGKLYSLVYWGGTPPSHTGTINVFDPLNNKDTAVLDFTGPNGAEPYGNFIQLKNGMLYGVTPYQGSHGSNSSGGVLLKYNIVTGQETVLYNFEANVDDANAPYGTLLMDTNGIMYGLSSSGGSSRNDGAIFSFDTSTNTEKVVDSLKCLTIGSYPTANLILATNGLLYGTTFGLSCNNGSIFSFNSTDGSTILLFSFNGTDGYYPRGSLLQVTDSLLYGLTAIGGTNNMGVLFSYNINTGIETVLVNFNDTNGEYPEQSLMQASNGKLYGTTVYGGVYGNGTLFSYDIPTNTETVLHSFQDTPVDGRYPYGDVIQASDGKLYGMTNAGGLGSHDSGTIFSYNLDSNVEHVLYSFNDINGALPYSDLLEVMSPGDSVTNNFCPNDNSGAMVINVRGGKPPLTYLWSTGATTSSISNLISGIYTYTVIDSRGITFTLSDTVKPLPIVFHFNVSNTCNGTGNGSVSVNASGGTHPYSFSWSSGFTTDTISNLSPGTYTCTINDAHGCNATDTVVITQSGVLTINGVTVTKSTFPNYDNGTITVHVSGGIPPGDSVYYLYLWSNGGSNNDSITNLDSGSYAVCVTSPYGCGSVCDSNIIILTNIENLDNPNSVIKVYPVPSNGLIAIDLVGYGFENLEISDAFGRQVYKQLLSPSLIDDLLLINLSALADGVYILHIYSQQSISTRKIIIQK